MKPCPFCGGRNITKALIGTTERFLGISDNSMASRWFARVRCLDCGTEQGRMEDHPLWGPPKDDDHDSAIEAWNQRTPSAPSADKLRIAVEALETSRENLIGWFEAIDAEIRVEHEMHVSLKDDLAVIDQALATLKVEGALNMK